jgi:hypothetical protein
MASGDVSKPYISAVQRSIELNFRSLSYASLRLSRALAVSERVMHRRLWKLRGQRQLLHPHDWQTRAELQTHLGALAVIQRQKGGGRVFSKEKHEFYDQDTTAAAAAAADATQQQQQQRGRAGQAEAEAEEKEAGGGDAERAAEGGAERSSAAAHGRLGNEEGESQAAHEQQDGSEADGGDSERPQLIALCGESPDFSGYLSSRLRRQRAERPHSRPAAAAAQAATSSPTQPQQGKEKEPPLFLSPAPHPPVPLSRPATSPLTFRSASRPLSLDEQAGALMSSIHSRHEEAQRELVYAGGRALSRQQESAAAEVQNLFSGVKDRWHTTFTELREIEQEEEEEQQERRRAKARRQRTTATAGARGGGQRQSGRQSARKAEAKAAATPRRPSTSPVTHRPTLPAASGLQRPATAGGASSLLSRAPVAPAHSSLPPSFPLPLSLSTFTRLAPIVRIPRDDDGPSSDWPAQEAEKEEKEEVEAVRGRPAVSVFLQQRDAVLRSNFVRFLSATEPQMWRQPGVASASARSGERSSLRLQAAPQRL